MGRGRGKFPLFCLEKFSYFLFLVFDGLWPREVREVIFNPPEPKFTFFPAKPQRFTIIREVGRLYILFLKKYFFFEDVPRLSNVVFDLPNLPTSLTISRNDVKQINRQWGGEEFN